MDIFYTIVIGLVVGIIAKFFLPGQDPGGLIVTTLLGIAGALVAKFLGQALNWYAAGEAVGFIASVFGAMVLLILHRLIFSRRKRRT